MSTVRPEIAIREATTADIPAIVALFAADTVGGHGDTTEPHAFRDYETAFQLIAASQNDTLYVAVADGEVVGTFQTTLIVSMSGRGSAGLTVEGVQTRADMRGRGIGEAMMRFAIERARDVGARRLQLTSNAARTDAHRFYERLGFAKSHMGFKLKL
jgi:GNAT superfamily N-acetyltransferase